MDLFSILKWVVIGIGVILFRGVSMVFSEKGDDKNE